jgi:hypothetical protein
MWKVFTARYGLSPYITHTVRLYKVNLSLDRAEWSDSLPDRFRPGKQPPFPTVYETAWAAELVLAL